MRADSPLVEPIILPHSMRDESPFFGIPPIHVKPRTPEKWRLEVPAAQMLNGLAPVLIAGMAIKKIIGGRNSAEGAEAGTLPGALPSR